MAQWPRTHTREGLLLPVLWGNHEITTYANAIADELGKPRLREGRTWTWDRMIGFPAPAAELGNGNVKVYLAEEMAPWIEHRIASMPDEPVSTVRLPDEMRAGIRADKGNASLRKTAAKFGVGATTVQRIWAGQ